MRTPDRNWTSGWIRLVQWAEGVRIWHLKPMPLGTLFSWRLFIRRESTREVRRESFVEVSNRLKCKSLCLPGFKFSLFPRLAKSHFLYRYNKKNEIYESVGDGEGWGQRGCFRTFKLSNYQTFSATELQWDLRKQKICTYLCFRVHGASQKWKAVTFSVKDNKITTNCLIYLIYCKNP